MLSCDAQLHTSKVTLEQALGLNNKQTNQPSISLLLDKETSQEELIATRRNREQSYELPIKLPLLMYIDSSMLLRKEPVTYRKIYTV